MRIMKLKLLITSAKRTYDSLRYILWNVFGPGKGSVPNNLQKTVADCPRLPADLRRSLDESWSSYGAKMTDYRDCTQHYVPVTSQLATCIIQ